MPKKKNETKEEDLTVGTEVISEAEAVFEKETKVVPEKETVELKKEDYDKLMSQLERNAKDIDLLYKAADKSRVAKLQGEGVEVLVKQVKIWTWADTGKVVISSELLSNRCEIVAGKWVEDQVVQVVLEDGEIVKSPYLEFSRKTLNKITADIVKKNEETDSNNNKMIIYTVQLPNGKKLKINSSFVN